MASEVQRYWNDECTPDTQAYFVLATDHDRVVAEARELLSEVRRRCSLPDWARANIDAWLEKNR